MVIHFHPHAEERMKERNATEEEVATTVQKGESFPAKYGRIGFRHNFMFQDIWRGKFYHTKQVEVFAVKENGGWLILTVVTRYF